MHSTNANIVLINFINIIKQGETPTNSDYKECIKKITKVLNNYLWYKYGKRYSEEDREDLIQNTIIVWIEKKFETNNMDIIDVINSDDENEKKKNEKKEERYLKIIAEYKILENYKDTSGGVSKKPDSEPGWGVNPTILKPPLGIQLYNENIKPREGAKKQKPGIIDTTDLPEDRTNFENNTFKDLLEKSLDNCIDKLPTEEYNLKLIAQMKKNDIKQNKIAVSLGTNTTRISRLYNEEIIPSLKNCLENNGWDEEIFYEILR